MPHSKLMRLLSPKNIVEYVLKCFMHWSKVLSLWIHFCVSALFFLKPTLDWMSALSLRSVSRKVLFFGSMVAHLCTSLKAKSSFPSFSRAWQRRYKALISAASTSIAKWEEERLLNTCFWCHWWYLLVYNCIYCPTFGCVRCCIGKVFLKKNRNVPEEKYIFA